jgi:hypothetical protein
MYDKNWACTPDFPAMIIVQHCSHSKQSLYREIYAIYFWNICNIFLVYRFSYCISSLSNLCMPRRKSWFLIWIFICHKLFKLITVQSEAGPQIWELSSWPEQGLCIQLTDVLSRAVHRLITRSDIVSLILQGLATKHGTIYLTGRTSNDLCM